MIVPFHKPSIGKEEIDAVVDTLKSGWLSSGPKVKQFEEEFADAVASTYAIAVNSCTAALHLSLEAVGLKENQYVITTPLTFAATAEVIRYFKAHPIFVDVNEDGNINPDEIEIAIKKAQTKGKEVTTIMPVHFAGRPCDMSRILKIANYNGLHVIEDAAHAFPSSIGIRPIGSISDMTCFSFYATKTLSTGEGGMITTHNKEYAERVKRTRLHGVDRDIWNRYNSDKPKWFYLVEDVGFKYNMSDIAAAMGIQQLRKSYDFWDCRKRISEAYNRAFSDMPLILPTDGDLPRGSRHAWHLYVVKIDPMLTNIKRDEFIELMAKHGVGTSVHFIPLHLHPYWTRLYNFKHDDFPKALSFYEQCVSLPIYPGMGEYETYMVTDTVRKIFMGVLK